MDAVKVWAEVLESEAIGENLFRLRLRAGAIAARARPGQFVMVGPLKEGVLDPFLNRPLSIHRLAFGDSLDLLVAAVGRGTRELGLWRPGARVGLMGPLGNGFEAPAERDRCLLVGGGVGVAPLVFLAESILAAGQSCTLCYGAATAGGLVDLAFLSQAGCRLLLATDDGSAGHHGFVTALLEQALLEAGGDESARLWVASCGPEPMMRVVARLCREHGIPALVSLENRMACGTGACMGCAEFVGQRPQRVCVEGPVFGAEEVFP